MQTAERRTVAGASETAGSLVFRPRERPPTQLHQAPSRLQRCAPSRLPTISGAAEPKSLSRLPSNNGEMERANTPPSSPGHCTFTRVRATIPRPKLRVGRHSSFASVLYQPKFPERIHGLFDCHHGDPQPQHALWTYHSSKFCFSSLVTSLAPLGTVQPVPDISCLALLAVPVFDQRNLMKGHFIFPPMSAASPVRLNRN